MSSVIRTNLSTFLFSMLEWLIDLTYHSVYYILMILMLAIFSAYSGWREAADIRSYHYFVQLINFGLKIDPNFVFDHSYERAILTLLMAFSLAPASLSIFYIIRSLPFIRLAIAAIGRDKYSADHFGYGKDDKGYFNENMRGRKVGWLRSLVYNTFVIGADKRSPSHIPQEPLVGSEFPKSGYFYDYYIYNRNLIGDKLGETHYVSRDEARYTIAFPSIISLFVLLGLGNGFFTDARYHEYIYLIFTFSFIAIVITHILSMTDIDEKKIINDFSPKEEGLDSTSELNSELTSEITNGVELGAYFKAKHKRGE